MAPSGDASTKEGDDESVSAASVDDGKAPQRDEWTNSLDFFMSCLGFAVGLGNVWRFPYLCYKNGGGAFLIPYFLCAVCVGMPLLILEISLGQYMRQSGIGIWQISPLFQGIGLCTTVIACLCNVYYIVIIAWDLYYLVMSFTTVLPWSHCNNTWNTERCFLQAAVNSSTVLCGKNSSVDTQHVDPVVEFWENKILKISDGVDNPGSVVWELAVALLLAWILVYFTVWKGVKVSGKIVYFTATFPYLVVTILLIRGVTLEGAADGILYYLKPDFSRLADAQVWTDAATQVLFSYAVAYGAMAALGSYNAFKYNCYRNGLIICVMNSATSFYAGFAMFSVLGFMAKQQGVCIQDVAESGPGLAFIAYPKAVTMMPIASFWAILFFLMILFLGLDSQFVLCEAVTAIVMDLFPVLRKPGRREITIAAYCVLSYLVGLSMVTQGGMYVFQLFDYYAASGLTLLWTCFFEVITIAWVYGGTRFYDDLELMLGYRPNYWLLICWTGVIPVVTGAIFISSWIPFKTLTYNTTYQYPAWAQGIGICLAFASMVWIPIVAVWQFIRTPGSVRTRWTELTTPVVPDHVLRERGQDVDRIGSCNGSQLAPIKDIESPLAYNGHSPTVVRETYM